MWLTIESGKKWKGIFKNRTKEEGFKYIETTIIPIKENNKVKEYLALRKDITSEQLKLRYCELTNLRSRLNLFELMKENPKTNFLLAIVNIDNFTLINHIFGGLMGDKVLKLLSKRLSSIDLDDFVLFRLKGDEFAYLKKINILDKNEENYINTIKNHISNISSKSFELSNAKVNIRLTAGVSINKGIFVLKTSNLALKKARELKKNISIFHEDMDKSVNEEGKDILDKVLTIQEALNKNKITVYYQPIVDNKTKKIVKYEALARLETETGEILTPYHFMEISQKVRLYNQITRKILERVFVEMERDQLDFSVNITMNDIYNHKTNKLIFDLLDNYYDPTKVTLEIVESVDVSDYVFFNKFSDKVRSYGAKIAIDDFGSGFSNFVHLTNIKFDYLKIDGFFVKNIIEQKNYDMIIAIQEFCNKHDIKVIAEFVENEFIYNKLKDLNVDFSQGYFFGKPERIIDKNIELIKE
jgi:diguanylate cyclase (GGDEF)-like protein